jgi:tetratricopeptide (TPR) repeat protein
LSSGELLLEEGDYAKSLAAFQSGLKALPKNNPSWIFETANAKLNMGFAHWAMRQRDDAFRVVLQATEDLIGDDDAINKAPFLSEVLLALHRLASTGIGTPEQRARADELFRKGRSLIGSGDTYSADIALRTQGVAEAHADASQLVQKVLSKAPGLDWARWSALYLALDDPEHGQELLRLLPEKSIQRRIAEVELRAAQTQPATP